MKRLRPYAASPAIQRKIEEEHQVSFEELEEAFARNPLLLRGETDQYGERRYLALGATESGRRLLTVFTVSTPGRAKVITARQMSSSEQRLYRSKRKHDKRQRNNN